MVSLSQVRFVTIGAPRDTEVGEQKAWAAPAGTSIALPRRPEAAGFVPVVPGPSSVVPPLEGAPLAPLP